MVFEQAGKPLRLCKTPRPEAGPGQVLIRVNACAVCRTDLHIVDGGLAEARPSVIPGHEIIGAIIETGAGVERFTTGDRVGVPWLGR